ncbi:MAG: hypothetical protein AAFP90_13960, partial [Planctomycetota bacterium]
MPQYQPFRAPRQHGQATITPPISDAPTLIANAADGRHLQCTIAGRDLQHWQQQSRGPLVRAALQYTRQYRDTNHTDAIVMDVGEAPGQRTPIVAAGHQPTLFHPGVWFKNFALNHIARQHGAVALNLIVDNDLAGPASVRVPVRSNDNGAARVVYQSVEYDSANDAVPHEQRRLHSPQIFQSFASRLRMAADGLVQDPSVVEFWPHAINAARRSTATGLVLAEMRHAMEGRLGLQTLELPLSLVCHSAAFAALVYEIATRATEFRKTYNRCLMEYRGHHRIRSASHPVPPLGIDGDWIELPFWVYSDASPRRTPVWARRAGQHVMLSNHVDWEAECP